MYLCTYTVNKCKVHTTSTRVSHQTRCKYRVLSSIVNDHQCIIRGNLTSFNFVILLTTTNFRVVHTQETISKLVV